jgi:hypothetical protein
MGQPPRKDTGLTAPDPLEELSRIRRAIRALRAQETALVTQMLDRSGMAQGASLPVHPQHRHALEESLPPPDIAPDAPHRAHAQVHRLRLRAHAGTTTEPAHLLQAEIIAIAHRQGQPGHGSAPAKDSH